MSITAGQVRFFEEQGYLTGLDVHDAAEASAIRKAFDELEAREGQENCEIGLQGRHIDQRFIWGLASETTILDCMEAIMGSDILVLSTYFFCKYPRATNKFVAWHQDVTYWGLEPPFALTAWYAVDDSDVEKRVHASYSRLASSGQLCRMANQAEPAICSASTRKSLPDVDDNQAVDLILKAGQMSIHHGHLIHGSNPNRSQRRRCGLTIRYCPPHVKPVEVNSLGKPWPAVLARGGRSIPQLRRLGVAIHKLSTPLRIFMVRCSASAQGMEAPATFTHNCRRGT